MADGEMKTEAEEELAPRRADMVGRFRDRALPGLAPLDLRRLDRGRVHDEPGGGLREAGGEVAEEHLLHGRERLASAVVAAALDEVGEEAEVVAAHEADVEAVSESMERASCITER